MSIQICTPDMTNAARAQALLAYTVTTPTGCRLWERGTTAHGYGNVTIQGRQYRVHRVVYECVKGPIPVGLRLLHGCDNPLCINPDHLTPGTAEENSQDMATKGRSGRGKLTLSDVLDIRTLFPQGATIEALAECFEVTANAIRYVLNRQTWRSV
jgi:hypothetical protein